MHCSNKRRAGTRTWLGCAGGPLSAQRPCGGHPALPGGAQRGTVRPGLDLRARQGARPRRRPAGGRTLSGACPAARRRLQPDQPRQQAEPRKPAAGPDPAGKGVRSSRAPRGSEGMVCARHRARAARCRCSAGARGGCADDDAVAGIARAPGAASQCFNRRDRCERDSPRAPGVSRERA